MNPPNQTSADHPPAPSTNSRPTPTKQIVYLLTYDASTWPNGVVSKDGNDPDKANYGVLGICVSQARAKSVGLEWASKQLHDRIEAYDPPLTQEEKDAAATDWLEHHWEGEGVWECEIRDRRAEESLIVKVEGFLVEDSGEEEEYDSEGEGV